MKLQVVSLSAEKYYSRSDDVYLILRRKFLWEGFSFPECRNKRKKFVDSTDNDTRKIDLKSAYILV